MPDVASVSVPFLDLGVMHAELGEQFHAALDETLASGRLIGGPLLDAFEERFAQLQKARHCVGVSNGLDALRLGLIAGGVMPGDEVLVPSHTFIATWLAVSQVGAVPVPVEPEPRSFNLDPDRLQAALTPRTRAIVPVHLYGRAAAMNEVMAFAAAHGLFVLEDAAQGFGATYQGRPLGALGHAAAWSFYPGKNLGALGDGGAVTTDDPALAARVRQLANYGSREKYVHLEQGWNARLDPLQAAFLSVKMRPAAVWAGRRDSLACRYLSALRGIPRLILPERPDHDAHGWHLFVVRTRERASLGAALDRAGIGWMIHYPVTPASAPAYAGSAAAAMHLPIAEQFSHEVLSLPLHAYLTDADQDRVIAAVTSWGTEMPGDRSGG